MTKDSWKSVPVAGPPKGTWRAEDPLHSTAQARGMMPSPVPCYFTQFPQISGTWTFKSMAAPSLVLLASEAAQAPGTSMTIICHLREKIGAIREGILQLGTREKGQSSKIQISPWEREVLLKFKHSSQEPREHSEHIPDTEMCNNIPLPNTLQFALSPSRVPKMSHFPAHQQCPSDQLTQTWTQTAFSAGFAQMESRKFVPRTCLYLKKNITHVYLLD